MPQYLSTDPNAGQEAAPQYLSTDPNAGQSEGFLAKAGRIATSPVSQGFVESVANRYPKGPGRENIRSLVGGAISPLGLAGEFAGALGIGARALRGVRAAKPVLNLPLPPGTAGRGPRIFGETLPPQSASVGRIRGPSQAVSAGPRQAAITERRVTAGGPPTGLAERRQFGIPVPAKSDLAIPAARQAELLQKLGGQAAEGMPTSAMFRPTTSRGPRATVQGAQGLTSKDIASVEHAIAEQTGVSPRITSIRPTPEAIKTVEAGRAARHGAYKSNARLDKGFKERIESEKGGIPLGRLVGGTVGGTIGGTTDPLADPDLDPTTTRLLSTAMGATLGSAGLPLLEAIRREAMLSGRAIPLNISTAMGAIPRAAIEQKTLAPFKEATNIRRNVQAFTEAFKSPTYRGKLSTEVRDPKLIGPLTRTIGAIDETTRRALRRSGLTDEAIDRLIHTAGPARPPGLETLPGRLAVPFWSTPMRVMGQGFKEIGSLSDWSNPEQVRRNLLTLAATGAGAGVGKIAESTAEEHPFATMMLSPAALAAAGPAALPATMAAIATGGRKVAGAISPISEPGFNPRQWLTGGLGLTKPAIVALMERAEKATGQRKAREKPREPRTRRPRG